MLSELRELKYLMAHTRRGAFLQSKVCYVRLKDPLFNSLFIYSPLRLGSFSKRPTIFLEFLIKNDKFVIKLWLINGLMFLNCLIKYDKFVKKKRIFCNCKFHQRCICVWVCVCVKNTFTFWFFFLKRPPLYVNYPISFLTQRPSLPKRIPLSLKIGAMHPHLYIR